MTTLCPAGIICVDGELGARDPDIYFTTSHFERSPIVLVLLRRVGLEELGETIAEAWLTRAPRKAAEAYLQGLAEKDHEGQGSATD